MTRLKMVQLYFDRYHIYSKYYQTRCKTGCKIKSQTRKCRKATSESIYGNFSVLTELTFYVAE